MRTKVFCEFPIPVERTVLDNGLTVITAEMPTSFARAQVVVRAGAMQDESLFGVAHFLEHMVYEGPAREGIHPRLRRFVRRGLRGNASTSIGETHYYVGGLNPDVIEAVPELLALTFDPSFDDEMVGKERGVIRQEIRQTETGREYARWRNRTLYPNDLRLHVSLAGTDASVQEIGGADMRAFHRRWYGSDNAAVIVTGGVSHEAVVAAVENVVLPGIGRDHAPLRFFPKLGTFEFVDARTASGLVFYLRAPDAREDVRFLDVGFRLLGHAVLGHLKDRLRLDVGEVYSVGKGLPDRYTREATIRIPSRPSSFARIEMETHSSFDWLRAGSFPEEAWETVIAEMCNDALADEEDMLRGSANGMWNMLRDRWLRGEITANPSVETLRATRPEDVARVFRSFVADDQLGVITVLPPSASTP